MGEHLGRTAFSILCLLALIAIAVGGVLEVLRQKRGESLLRPGQFRLRIFSVVVWILLLGSLAYAIAFLWPHDKALARQFLTMVSGSFLLLLIALLLLAYDVWQIGKQRRLSERRFEQRLEGLALEEMKKIESKNMGSPPPTSPEKGMPDTK